MRHITACAGVTGRPSVTDQRRASSSMDSAGDPDTEALIAFNDTLARDDRVDVVVLTIRDGVSLVRKR